MIKLGGFIKSSSRVDRRFPVELACTYSGGGGEVALKCDFSGRVVDLLLWAEPFPFNSPPIPTYQPLNNPFTSSLFPIYHSP